MTMKTEQEQIKAMTEKMKRCFEKNGLLNFKWFAEALVQAGYGDISEYKAEIERLKDEIIYLERKIAIRDNALKDSDKAIEMLEGKQDTIVKQAQIDVLKELKEKIQITKLNDDTALVIIEMIEELKK